MEDPEACSSPIPERSELNMKTSLSCEGQSEPLIPQFPKPDDYDKWTPCKKQSWDQLQNNPNGFFYRHVLPGEEKRNGPWSEEEKLKFIEVLKQEPIESTHWGLLARKIPGRVGYQCNAFFKKLVASGELQRLAPDIKIPEIKVKDPADPSKPRKKKAQVLADGNVVVKNVEKYSYECSLEEERPMLVIPNVPKTKYFTSSFSEESNNSARIQFMQNAKIFF